MLQCVRVAVNTQPWGSPLCNCACTPNAAVEPSTCTWVCAAATPDGSRAPPARAKHEARSSHSCAGTRLPARCRDAELTLARFYELLHELEQAKAMLELA